MFIILTSIKIVNNRIFYIYFDSFSPPSSYPEWCKMSFGVFDFKYNAFLDSLCKILQFSRTASKTDANTSISAMFWLYVNFGVSPRLADLERCNKIH